MTYEYQCENCRTAFVIKATVAEKSQGLEPECPTCGCLLVTQVYTSLAMVTRAGGGGTPPCCGPGPGSGCCG